MSSLEFVFKIYELPNKKIAESYVSNISKQMDEHSLNYSFQLISEDMEEDLMKRMVGGSDSTYPYKYFEDAMNNISNRFKGINQKTPEAVSNRQGLFDRLFSSSSANSTKNIEKTDEIVKELNETVVENEGSENIDDITRDLEKNEYTPTKNAEPIVFPTDYMGVLIIHLKILNVGDENQYIGGLKQFENWIKKRV
jgi:hypothetical protein